MGHLIDQMLTFSGNRRTYRFRETGDMIQFLQHYVMGVEKILKTTAMDEQCT